MKFLVSRKHKLNVILRKNNSFSICVLIIIYITVKAIGTRKSPNLGN